MRFFYHDFVLVLLFFVAIIKGVEGGLEEFAGFFLVIQDAGALEGDCVVFDDDVE